jgi:hypothetical protein
MRCPVGKCVGDINCQPFVIQCAALDQEHEIHQILHPAIAHAIHDLRSDPPPARFYKKTRPQSPSFPQNSARPHASLASRIRVSSPG